MDKLTLTQDIIDEINGLGKGYNGFKIRAMKDIPLINKTQFPQIRTSLKMLNPPVYDFKKIFTDDNELTFAPKNLVFNADFIQYLKENEDEILFYVKTAAHKKFLIYLGNSLAPTYIWETVSTEVAEEEPVTSDEEEDS